MELYYQTHSPFARKVLVFCHETGLVGKIKVTHHETSPTVRNNTVHSDNPLGKVPVLIRPGAEPLFDSDVICAYLDSFHEGSPLIPSTGEERWQALQLQALGQGLAEAGIALRWETERRPPAYRYPPLVDGLGLKLTQAYAWLESSAHLLGRQLNLGQIAVATALSWIAFRELPMPDSNSKVARWLSEFEARPSMRATVLHGETFDR
jgi:glutathione S-transferase